MEIEHKYLSINGLKIHIAQIGKDEFGTVVFLHGFPEIWYSWRHQMVAVAESGYRAIAPDWRGYGLSDQPTDPENASREHLISDLLCILDALSIPKAFLVGKDFGSYPAYLFALLYPDRTSGVVSIGMPYSPEPFSYDQLPEGFYIKRWQEPGRAEADFGRYDVKRVVRTIYILFSRSEIPVAPEGTEIMDLVDLSTPLPEWFTEEDLSIYASLYEKNGFTYPLQIPYRVRSIKKSSLPSDPTIWVPVLLVQGEKDYLYRTPGRYEAVNEGIMKKHVPDLEITFVPEGCHFAQEQFPDQVNQLIRTTIIQLFASKDKPLLVRRDPLFVLNLGLYIVDRVRALDFKRNGLASQGLDEDLHPAPQSEHQMQCRLLLDVIVGKSATIVELLAGKDKPLLVRRNALLILNLGLHIVNCVGALDLKSYGLANDDPYYAKFLPKRIECKMEIEHCQLLINGLSLYIAHIGKDELGTVLFLHGFPEIWYSWRRDDCRSQSGVQNDCTQLAWIQVFLVVKDFGASLAYLFILHHADRARGLVSVGVPFTPMLGYYDPLPEGFYIKRWREPGRAEADFGRFDAKQIVRRIYILFSRSEIPVAPEEKEIMDLVDVSTPLPEWFAEEDLSKYASLYEQNGFVYPLHMPYRALARVENMSDPRIEVPVLLIQGEKDYVFNFLAFMKP